MTTDSNDSEERKDLLWQGYHCHHRKAEDEENRGLSYYVRQVLNVLFLLLAVAGLVLWYAVSKNVGAYTLIAALVFKFAELSLRIMKI